MKTTQKAILLGQALSFLLIVTFIFANHRFNFLPALLGEGKGAATLLASYTAACLVAMVGVVSIWITFHYLTKSNSMREMVVVCAWTQRVKVEGRWVSMREFLSGQLGLAVTHGMCPEKIAEMRAELDQDWKDTDEDIGEVKKMGLDVAPKALKPRQDSPPRPAALRSSSTRS